mgnify:FL=1
MDILLDPSIWIGLCTLVILEIVLGIDNLVFIAILADKLPPKQRDKARIIGLTLALVTRLLLLTLISWLVTLTEPLFSVGMFTFSGRDLILLFGGIFLLYKAVVELHEKLEGAPHEKEETPASAKFGLVVAQIVVLDAVFSLDSVITAVGMVDELFVMMAAVVIAIGVMLLASKPLMEFVNKHPTVVILCLSFLLTIGVSLIADGLGFHIPKGYIYSGIGFAILIEAFNQCAKRNQMRHASRLSLRRRAAGAIFRLMGGQSDAPTVELEPQLGSAFIPEERYMMSGVLSLAQRKVKTIMVPRDEVSWINIQDSADKIKDQILTVPHNLMPLCDGSLDRVLSVVRGKAIINAISEVHSKSFLANLPKVHWIDENKNVIECMKTLRQARGSLVLVKNQKGELTGLVTPLDLLEAIAGEFPDSDEAFEIVKNSASSWVAEGDVSIFQVRQELGLETVDDGLVQDEMLGVYLAKKLQKPLKEGMVFETPKARFTIKELQNGEITKVSVQKL